MRFSIFQESRKGGREANEDRTSYAYTRDSLLMVVADGMGGHLHGEVAAQIAEAESNIDNVAIGPEQGDQYATITFTLQVLNRLHLAHIMRALRRTPEVIRISRVKN